MLISILDDRLCACCLPVLGCEWECSIFSQILRRAASLTPAYVLFIVACCHLHLSTNVPRSLWTSTDCKGNQLFWISIQEGVRLFKLISPTKILKRVKDFNVRFRSQYKLKQNYRNVNVLCKFCSNDFILMIFVH